MKFTVVVKRKHLKRLLQFMPEASNVHDVMTRAIEIGLDQLERDVKPIGFDMRKEAK